MSRTATARAFLGSLVDAGSYQSWDQAPDRCDATSEYVATLARAEQRAGTDESVLTGRATIGGRPVALVVSEFRFLGGSVGRAATGRIVAALHRATTERLAVLAAPASGGTRMQEGTPAFVGMVDITRAVEAHKEAGLPYLVYLRHPTTGGAMASWGSLGHLTLAEPGAMTGFLGPSVYEALHGVAFPKDVQTAEHLVHVGIADAVVPFDAMPTRIESILRLLDGGAGGQPVTAPDVREPAGGTPSATTVDDPWPSITTTRHEGRPGVRELLHHAADEWVLLSGSGAGERAHGLVIALTSIRGHRCVMIGQDRAAQRDIGPIGPADLRVARRGLRMAGQLGLPVVTVVDTPGAELSVEAEEGALAGEIARCIADLTALPVPSVAVLLGEGCGGGALALLPARRVVTTAHGWLAPLPPEGASTILHGSTSRAGEMARHQRVGANALLQDEIVHAIVPEPVPAHEDPVGFCERVADAIATELAGQRDTDLARQVTGATYADVRG